MLYVLYGIECFVFDALYSFIGFEMLHVFVLYGIAWILFDVFYSFVF